MMTKKIFAAALMAATLLGSASAQDNNTVQFKPYGFIRNYVTFDSRECIAGTGDMYFYMPKDENWNKTDDPALREDLNALSSVRFLSLTTRVGLNIVGYKWRNARASEIFFRSISA